MRKTMIAASAAASLIASLHSTSALANDAEMDALRKEIKLIKQAYESRISALEAKLKKVETVDHSGHDHASHHDSHDGHDDHAMEEGINPSIGVVLQGQYRNYSKRDSEIAGFAVGEEGERKESGFGVDHTEVYASGKVGDKFYGSVTAALAEHHGETEVELEEAFVQTLPGLGLPEGMTVKFGRALWRLGTLNEQHTHEDNFADRPLPYRVFLDQHFNDDGVQVSYKLPTSFYSEVGGGIFRGNDFPYGESDGNDLEAYSLYARIGGDIAKNHRWRVGAYYLGGSAGERESNEDELVYIGDTDLLIADVEYRWQPFADDEDQELLLQAEYFWRAEDGFYEDLAAGSGSVAFDDHSSGWYAEAVYKFAPQWRAGYRFTQLHAADVPAGLVGTALDGNGHDPYIHSVMADWTYDHASRLRLQYNHDKSVEGKTDDQILLQYILRLGVHGH